MAYVVEEDVDGKVQLRIEVLQPEAHAVALAVGREAIVLGGGPHLAVRGVSVIEAVLIESHELDLQLQRKETCQPIRAGKTSEATHAPFAIGDTEADIPWRGLLVHYRLKVPERLRSSLRGHGTDQRGALRLTN